MYERRHLTSEEVQSIREVLKQLDLKEAALARRIGAVPGNLNSIMNRKRPITSDIAERMYASLDYNIQVAFLADYAGIERLSEEDAQWTLLYRSRTASLLDVYRKSGSLNKGAILGELEGLVEKYKRLDS